MHTIRTHFGGIDPGVTFIYLGVVHMKAAPGEAVNCQTLHYQHFKPDQLVEIPMLQVETKTTQGE